MRRIEEKKLSMHVEAFVVMLISLEKTLSILDGNCMDPWTANCSFYYECYYRLIKTKNTEHQHTIEALWYTYMSYLWHLQRFMCKCLLANAIDRLFPSLWKLHLFISRIGGKDHTILMMNWINMRLEMFPVECVHNIDIDSVVTILIQLRMDWVEIVLQSPPPSPTFTPQYTITTLH